MLACLFLSEATACVYNVRDMGFVDFGAAPYRLYCYVRDGTPQEIVSRFKEISYATLLDSNVEFETVNLERQPDHPAMEYLRFWEIQSTPALALVSPKGRSLVLPVSGSVTPAREAIWNSLESVVTSAKREEILQHIVSAYSVVLFIEGEDPAENRAAYQSVAAATEKVVDMMRYLPKQIDEPPYIVVIPRAMLAREKVLLWSLGIDEERMRQPCVAVIYGTGRRIGSVLAGWQIRGSALLGTLATIGLSCECGLDRQWLLGSRIPLRWGERIRSQVTKKLGFDPENPMVKTEMSMIMALGLAASEGAPDEYNEEVLPLTSQANPAGLSPAQFRELVSPPSASSIWGLPLRSTLLSIGAGGLFVLVGVLLIFLRARRRLS